MFSLPYCILIEENKQLMDSQEHDPAPSPPMSLLRVSAATTSSTVDFHRMSSVQLSGAVSSHDARERAIPMTPILLASFPSQLQQNHHGEQLKRSRGVIKTLAYCCCYQCTECIASYLIVLNR